MTFVSHDRRAKLSYEAIFVIFVTLAGWLTNAGMMYQHILDTEKRVERLEKKFDDLSIRLMGNNYGQTR